MAGLRTEQSKKVLYTASALEPAVRLALSRAGYQIVDNEITIIERTRTTLGEPVSASVPNGDPPDRALLDLVQKHERGLIRCGHAVKVDWLIAQIALAWPEMTIAVAVWRREEAWRLAKALRKYLGRVSVMTGAESPATVGRVVVSTYLALGNSPRYPGERHRCFDISWLNTIIALDAVEATGKVAMECLSFALRARIYGLIAADAKPAPLECDHMRVLFGFAEASIPDHGCRVRPVQVVRYPIKGGMTLPRYLDAVDLKRQGIWHNAVRNRKIVKFALAFHEGRSEELVRNLPKIKTALDNAPIRGILVLVENLEHARELAQLLPGWALWTGENVHEEGLRPVQTNPLGTPPNPFGPARAIVTAERLRDVLLNEVDVLIRADGGVGVPPFGAGSLVEPDFENPRPLLLVDFNDKNLPVLRKWSKARKHAYEEHSWLAPGQDPMQWRVEHFLETRPGRTSR
jgi:hypothetical protein